MTFDKSVENSINVKAVLVTVAALASVSLIDALSSIHARYAHHDAVTVALRIMVTAKAILTTIAGIAWTRYSRRTSDRKSFLELFPLQPINDNKVLWFTASQLAAKYDKEAQTIRVWSREGFFIERGYRLQKDPTGHWRVGIPADHADYSEFLAFSKSIKR